MRVFQTLLKMTLKLKTQLFITFIFLFGNFLFSQTDFKKGEFITNADETVVCFIKDLDWKNNPTEISYKLTEAGDVKNGDILTVKSFEIFGSSKFVRATVSIDRSSSNISSLTENRNPEFTEEQLFLRVLLGGKATLYYYEDSLVKRFFYNLEADEITQLIYKKYIFDTTRIGENNHYKQQLLNALQCEAVSVNNLKTIGYNTKDLTTVFEKYNTCVGGDAVVNYQEKEKKDIFNFRAKVGVGSASLAINNFFATSQNVDFGNGLMYRFGGELEVLLPFNNNKWAIVLEPSYQGYSLEKNTGAKVDYMTIEIPFGIRHYFYLNTDSKIFINALYSLVFTNDSSILRPNLELDNSNGQSFGVGYSFKKLSLECRYEITRDVLGAYQSWESNYNQVSLIFGYQIF